MPYVADHTCKDSFNKKHFAMRILTVLTSKAEDKLLYLDLREKYNEILKTKGSKNSMSEPHSTNSLATNPASHEAALVTSLPAVLDISTYESPADKSTHKCQPCLGTTWVRGLKSSGTRKLLSVLSMQV